MLEQTYRRCYTQALGLAMSLLHDEEDARDVVQEVFTRLLERNAPSLPSPSRQRADSPVPTDSSAWIGNPDALVYRSVRNACLNHIEQMTTRERIRRLLPLELSEFPEYTDFAGHSDRIEAVQRAADVLLSRREEEVVREVFADGHNYKEAAANLGVSVSAINKHVVNALRKLRNHFKTNES